MGAGKTPRKVIEVTKWQRERHTGSAILFKFVGNSAAPCVNKLFPRSRAVNISLSISGRPGHLFCPPRGQNYLKQRQTRASFFSLPLATRETSNLLSRALSRGLGAFYRSCPWSGGNKANYRVGFSSESSPSNCGSKTMTFKSKACIITYSSGAMGLFSF